MKTISLKGMKIKTTILFIYLVTALLIVLATNVSAQQHGPKKHYYRESYVKHHSYRITPHVQVNCAPTPTIKKSYRNVWVEGHWVYDAQLRRDIWVEGQWVKEVVKEVWVPGQWVRTHRGTEWQPGYWEVI